MRTIILVGALLISDAIRGNTSLPYGDNVMSVLVVILLAAILMDFVDFVRGKSK